MNINPMQLIQLIKSGQNPQQLVMNILQQKSQTNPILNNAMNLAQNGNQYYDWIEIYNNSPVAINLGEYYLTTDKDDKKMNKLPDYQLAPGIHYLLMASGDTSLSNSQYNHTNFKLSSAKGLLLYKQNIQSFFSPSSLNNVLVTRLLFFNIETPIQE